MWAWWKITLILVSAVAALFAVLFAILVFAFCFCQTFYDWVVRREQLARWERRQRELR